MVKFHTSVENNINPSYEVSGCQGRKKCKSSEAGKYGSAKEQKFKNFKAITIRAKLWHNGGAYKYLDVSKARRPEQEQKKRKSAEDQ